MVLGYGSSYLLMCAGESNQGFAVGLAMLRIAWPLSFFSLSKGQSSKESSKLNMTNSNSMNKTVFLLGAGYSHFISNGKIPITTQLVRAFLSNYPQYEEYENALIADYEGFFTKHSLEKGGDPYELEIIKRFIATCFKELDHKSLTSSDLEKAKEYCDKLFTHNDTIISFN
ncbi:MAG: hypothetical protein KDD52_06490 [Bdellovibrionales bacterium]|nr:hypothetical protein [Bdellovibrionales bacterium]